jgi:hypothetical protein
MKRGITAARPSSAMPSALRTRLPPPSQPARYAQRTRSVPPSSWRRSVTVTPAASCSTSSKAKPQRASTSGSERIARWRTGSISTWETRIGASSGMEPSFVPAIRRRHSTTEG